MKKQLFIWILGLVTITSIQAQDYYLFTNNNGTGNNLWNNPSNWTKYVSGVSVGIPPAPPSSADNAIIDVSKISATPSAPGVANRLTLDATGGPLKECNSFSLTNMVAGKGMNLSYPLDVYTNFDLSAGGTAISFSVSGSIINLRGTSTTYTINSNQTASIPQNVINSDVRIFGDYTLADQLTVNNLQVNTGAKFNSNSKNIATRDFSVDSPNAFNVSNSTICYSYEYIATFNGLMNPNYSGSRVIATDTIPTIGTTSVGGSGFYLMGGVLSNTLTIPRVHFRYTLSTNKGNLHNEFPVVVNNVTTKNNLSINNKWSQYLRVDNLLLENGLDLTFYDANNAASNLWLTNIIKAPGCQQIVNVTGGLALTASNALDYCSFINTTVNMASTGTLTATNSFNIYNNTGKLVILGPSVGRTLKWVGAGVNNSWNTPNNWFDIGAGAATSCPPTPLDSVILDYSLATGFKSALIDKASFCAGMSLKGQNTSQTFTLNATSNGSLYNTKGLYIGYNAGLVATTDTFVSVTLPNNVWFVATTRNNGIATQGVLLQNINGLNFSTIHFAGANSAKWYMVDNFRAPLGVKLSLEEGHLELAYRPYPNDMVTITAGNLVATAPLFTNLISPLGDKRDTLTLKRAKINLTYINYPLYVENSSRTLCIRRGPLSTDKSTVNIVNDNNYYSYQPFTGPFCDRVNTPCIQFWNLEIRSVAQAQYQFIVGGKNGTTANLTFNKVTNYTPVLFGYTNFGAPPDNYVSIDTLDVSNGFPVSVNAPYAAAKNSILINNAIFTNNSCTAPYVGISSNPSGSTANIMVANTFTMQPQRLNIDNITINSGIAIAGYTTSVTTINSVLNNTTTGWINSLGAVSLFYWNGEGLGDASNAVAIKNANWNNPRNWNVSTLDPTSIPKYSTTLGSNNIPLAGVNDDPNTLFNTGGCVPGPFDSVVFVNTSFPSSITNTVTINVAAQANAIKWATSLSNVITWNHSGTASSLNLGSSLYLDNSIISAKTFSCPLIFTSFDANNRLMFSDKFLRCRSLSLNGTGTWNMMDSLCLSNGSPYTTTNEQLLYHYNGTLKSNGYNMNVSSYVSYGISSNRLLDITNSRVMLYKTNYYTPGAYSQFVVSTTNYSIVATNSKLFLYSNFDSYNGPNSIILYGNTPLKFNDIYFYRNPANPIGSFSSIIWSNASAAITHSVNTLWSVTEDFSLYSNWNINTLRLQPYSVNIFEAGKTITVDSLIAVSQNCSAGGTIKSSILGTRVKLYEKTGNAPLSVTNFNMEDAESNTAPTYTATGNHTSLGTGVIKSNGVAGNPLNGWQTSSLTVAYKFGFDTLKINCHDNATYISTANFLANPDSYYQWKYETSPGIFTAITATNSTISSIQPKKPGRYYVRVVYINPGCFAQDTVVVTISNKTIANSNVTQMTCNGANNGSVNYSLITNTNTAHFYQYTWATGGSAVTNTGLGQTSSSYSNLAQGVYTVTVIDTTASITSCKLIQTFTIDPVSSLTLAASGNSVTCFGASTATMSAIASGANGGYTYVWTNGVNTYSSQNVNGAPSGNYTVTTKDSKGCNTNATLTVIQPTSAVSIASSSSSSVACFGASTGSAIVNATGGTPGYTYSWTSVGSTTNSATGLAAGNYTATVKDANLCTTTQSFVITQPASAVSISSSNSYSVLCFGASTGSASLVPAGGTPSYTYSWTSVGSTTNSATGLAAGNYTATVTDANLCITTQSFVIDEPTYLDVVLTATTQADCGLSNGSATVTATGGTPIYTYSWTPPSPAISFTTSAATTNSLAAGITQLAVADANGCVTPVFITISNPNAPVITPTQTNVLCYGNATGSATVDINAGTAPYTYSWSPSVGSSTNTAYNLTSGNYIISVVDAANCTAGYVFAIMQPTAPLTANVITTNSILCYGASTGSAAINPTGGTPSYTISWQGNLSTTTSASAYAAGNYTYQVTDANSCVTSNSFSISQPSAALSATATQSNVVCYGTSTGSVTINVSGGTSGYSYSWIATSSTTNTATGLIAGDYTATVTDGNGCSITQTITISEPANLTVTVSATTQAGCGLANGQATVTTTGGTPTYTYSWTNASNSYTTTAATTSSLSAGNNQLMVTDANGCSTNTVITITNPNAPVVTTTVTDVACYGANTGVATALVTSSSAYTYTWSNGSNAASISGLPAGTYTIMVQDNSSCVTLQTATITQPISPVSVSITNATNVNCYGGNNGSATALASGGTPNYTYTWQPGNINTTSINNLFIGNYTVTTTDANGCVTNSIVAIINNPTILLQASVINSEPSVCEQSNGSITIGVIGGTPSYSYTWNTGTSNNETLSNISAGNYAVIVTDALGCMDTVNVSIDCKINLFIPEIFSPNGDGKNEKFEIKGIESYPNNTISIFNRWGSLIYSKSKYKNEWDGKANVGDATCKAVLPSGTYYVVLNFGDGNTEPYHGFVQLEF